MKMKNPWLLMLPCIAVTPATGFAATSEASNVIEEVVVTSRKREESLRDVPIAVTAVTAESIKELRIDNIGNVAAITPNLVVNTSAGGSPSAVACLRGMCRTNTIITEDPMVGTYVDGVYLGKAVGSLIDVLDLERVEVLRGPQGTLFGKNTLGGAINLVTRKPGDEFSAQLRAGIGNEGQQQFRVGIDVPMGEKLSARLSYLNKQRDPAVSNPTGADFGDEDVNAGMLALRFKASDALTIDYSFDQTRVRQLAAATTLSFANLPQFDGGGNCISGCTLLGWTALGVDLSQNVAPEFTDSYVSDGQDHHQDMDVQGHSLVAQWDISDNLTLKSITALREVEVDYRLSFGTQIFVTSRTVDSESFSQEFQLQGIAADGALNYTLGLFYYDEEGEETNTQDIPGFFVEVGYDAEIASEALAIFGEASYQLSDQWDLTLGLRYTQEDKSADKIAYALPSGFVFMDTRNGTYNGTTTLPDGSPVQYERDIDNSSVSPRVSIRYTPNDDWMVYATYARGYKSGGFNAASTSPVSWVPFDDVILDSFELGFKASLLDGRAQLNVTAFRSEADDMQVQVNRLSPVGSFEAVLTNAGQAEINGLEIEALIRATERLDIMLGLGLQDAEFSEYLQPDGTDVSDQRVLEFTPDYSYNLGLRYLIADAEWGQLSARIDLHGVDSHDFQPVPAREVAEDGYDLLDARIAIDGITLGGGELSLALWGKNLTDESYRTGGFTFTQDFGFNSYGLPRLFGLEANYSF
jgi:iron complex outermembrane receptor protein